MGRLAFGYEQNLQFDIAMKTCQKALDHTPKDIWAVHAMAHIYEETQRYPRSPRVSCLCFIIPPSSV